uniref:Ig-like domain-containing protein n=1 Tax=Salarias fasciatus TaxID=181472 RepID=A0A672F4G5_SALFA
ALRCAIDGGNTGWEYEWETSSLLKPANVSQYRMEALSSQHQGEYRCKGNKLRGAQSTDWSNTVTLRVLSSAVLKIDPGWSTLFIGEVVTLTCDIEGAEAGWEYSFNKDQQQYSPGYQTTKYYRFKITSSNDGGEYDCVGRQNVSSETEKSETVSFTAAVSVLPQPKAQLGTNKFNMSEGSRVTLTCSVNQPAGWKYFWYRDSKTSLLNTHDTDEYQSQSEVSQEGRYWCRGGRGGRGDPLYYTEYSDPISATLTLQHDRPQLYQGETIALRCAIDGGNTGWEYEWETSSLLKPANVRQYRMEAVSSQHQGEYRCKGNKLRGAQSTDWSNTVTLTVLSSQHVLPFHLKKNNLSPSGPKLSVSPSWLIPGASVTLICHTEPPSAGWSFYWFKAVPNSQDSYTYEPLPGTSSGTANNSFTVHGQTHTAGYACSAGRGDPLIYTQHSRPTFVWSSGQFVFLELLNCCLPTATIEMPSFTEP